MTHGKLRRKNGERLDEFREPKLVSISSWESLEKNPCHKFVPFQQFLTASDAVFVPPLKIENLNLDKCKLPILRTFRTMDTEEWPRTRQWGLEKRRRHCE